MKRLLLTGICALVMACWFQRPEAGANSRLANLASENAGMAFLTTSVAETDLRAASTNAIKLMQQAQTTWSKRETCASCHHQLLPEITFGLARAHGVPVDENVARAITAATFSFMKDLDGAVQRYDYIDVVSDGWLLVAANAAGVRPNLSTAAYAQSIASHQLPDGNWMTTDVRPPQSYGPFNTTAVCARALRDYMPEESANMKREKALRLSKARAWLIKAIPRTTEERAFQLLGLKWAGADTGSRRNAAAQLLAAQREDGGWSEMPGLESDAYSTGEVLVALGEGVGLPPSDPAYQRGMSFLLKSQQPDGSWHVRSRLHPPAPVSPPYFEAGFPYHHEQFISIMGTAWAANAMLGALPPASSGAAPPDVAPAEDAKWIRAALTGSAEDLKRLLDSGTKPDVRTTNGTTALMLAARDIAKVKLLVERGADVNARAATGLTPLMVAAQFGGNTEVLRFLLKKGASPNPGVGVEVRNSASATFFALMSGDAEMLRVLLEAGARIAPMKVLGRFDLTPLVTAAGSDMPAIVELLLERGCNPNEKDGDGISVLDWAAISNRAENVRVLLAHGAEVNYVDRLGMTPLLYAASIDFGDTGVIQRLIAAGADLRVANKDGLTAIDLARNYHHRAIEKLLSEPAAHR